MLDMFNMRMRQRGATIGEIMAQNSDMIMDETFMNDLRTRKVRVHHEYKGIDKWTYAKYQEGTDYSISGDNVAIKLQFRPGEHYPVGCYVDVPDDVGEYNTWLIVGRNDKAQFVRYFILKCNWEVKWILDGVIHKCLAVLRYRNSYNSGVDQALPLSNQWVRIRANSVNAKSLISKYRGN